MGHVPCILKEGGPSEQWGKGDHGRDWMGRQGRRSHGAVPAVTVKRGWIHLASLFIWMLLFMIDIGPEVLAFF